MVEHTYVIILKRHLAYTVCLHQLFTEEVKCFSMYCARQGFRELSEYQAYKEGDQSSRLFEITLFTQYGMFILPIQMNRTNVIIQAVDLNELPSVHLLPGHVMLHGVSRGGGGVCVCLCAMAFQFGQHQTFDPSTMCLPRSGTNKAYLLTSSAT